ncbi:MAG: DNA-binding protein WhiA [Lachnospiraceae bacterium]|mgnify:FL=1|jgi:DNA-binding protein WhiA|nr:DNA-binding protein WhiA [Lachnospiraceae bacterium]MCI5881703.1 DNA-binding protein WhiA [Clostridium sp.]MDD6179025.1 DNA-binding protein WhiA [Clostridium sp.]MDY4821274.1 DNA-binding protein WhiA [Lachnospiraceae bacterium]MED9806483.1 DNA-binding protein WhiA [Lachnospiraceae bacterium]
MSFSAEVKEELAKHISPARHCQMAELSAMLHYAGQYGLMEDGTLTIGFQSENEAVLRKGFTLLKKAYNIDTVIGVKGQKKADLLAIMGDLSGPADTSLLKQACCRRAFIRGAFLSCGSISDPTKGYHLEFVCNNRTQAEQLQEIIGQFDIEAKIVCRKKYFVVYVKEGAGIVELLNIMEAHVALMNLENLRILKEMRNSINRRVNCEAANIQKTVQASTRQVEDIIYLRDYYGFSRLPDNLREMAEVRLAYPEAALKELGEYLSPPVGKSGVNHRLRKLSELAEKLRS